MVGTPSLQFWILVGKKISLLHLLFLYVFFSFFNSASTVCMCFVNALPSNICTTVPSLSCTNHTPLTSIIISLYSSENIFSYWS